MYASPWYRHRLGDSGRPEGTAGTTAASPFLGRLCVDNQLSLIGRRPNDMQRPFLNGWLLQNNTRL